MINVDTVNAEEKDNVWTLEYIGRPKFRADGGLIQARETTKAVYSVNNGLYGTHHWFPQ